MVTDNWRRRIKRLERAYIVAAGDIRRQRAVRLAHNRLTNLRSRV